MGVEIAGFADGLFNGCWRDLVEHHALHRHLGIEDLNQVPRDGLAFAVFVGREIELFNFLEGCLQFGDNLLAARGNDVDRLEVIVDVDAESGPLLTLDRGGNVGGTLGQIADVTDRWLDDEVLAEHGLNTGGLRDRFNNYERTRHGHHLSRTFRTYNGRTLTERDTKKIGAGLRPPLFDKSTTGAAPRLENRPLMQRHA